jgi:glycosyltransferase involved in cell wall biosynthesis
LTLRVDDVRIVPVISLVVPTRNRAHALALTARSYYAQPPIDEIIFVNDGGTDGTPELIEVLASEHPAVRTLVLRNDQRLGCAASRTRGFRAASNELVLFCDDDEHMLPGYAEAVARKLDDPAVGACCGRRVLKTPGESLDEAVTRFALGERDRALFDYATCDGDWRGYANGDVDLPLLPSAFVTRRSLLDEFGFDPRFNAGNGYREESDYHMSLFTAGYRLVFTNDAHTVHLSRSECHSGGNRTPWLARVYWRVALTGTFYTKHWDRYAALTGQRLGPRRAWLRYALLQMHVPVRRT